MESWACCSEKNIETQWDIKGKQSHVYIKNKLYRVSHIKKEDKSSLLYKCEDKKVHMYTVYIQNTSIPT